MGGYLNKRLLFIDNYYCYEMCCLKRKVSALERSKDSKAWCPLRVFIGVETAALTFRTKQYSTSYGSHICCAGINLTGYHSPHRAEPHATNFFRQNAHPRDSFSVQNSGPRVEKTKQKSPPPGITCPVRMPRDQ